MENNYSYCSLSKKTVSGGNCLKSGRLSTDPQSVAARERRHRISDRFKILQSMVPGGTKMDTVSMLDEAIQYVKFLKAQIWLHQRMINDGPAAAAAAAASTGLHLPLPQLPPAAASDTSLFPSQYPDHFGAVDNVYYFNNGGDHQSLLPPLPPLPPELQRPVVPVPEQMSYYYDAYTINHN